MRSLVMTVVVWTIVQFRAWISLSLAVSLALFAGCDVIHAQNRDAARPTPNRQNQSSKIAALVGFRIQNDKNSTVEENVSAFRYETWLIVSDGSRAHVEARLKDIIVPRKNGFWRIGVQPTCQFTPPNDLEKDLGNVHTEAILYAGPIEKQPQFGLTDQQCDAKTAARVLNPAYDPNQTVEPTENANAPTECGFRTTWIEAVLPDLISVASHDGQSEACEPRGFHWRDNRWVQDLSISPSIFRSDKVALEAIFGEAGRLAWQNAIRASIRKQTGEGCFGNESPDNYADITNWYFVRSDGRYRAIAFVQIGNGGCQLDGDTGLKLPRTLTGEPALSAKLARSPRKSSDHLISRDDRFSPNGDLFLEETWVGSAGAPLNATVSGVDLYECRSGKEPCSILLELPAEHVIMVQWATGRYADQWISILQAADKRGLPVPILRGPVQ